MVIPGLKLIKKCAALVGVLGLCFLIGLSPVVQAQEASVHAYFLRDTIDIQSGNTFSNQLVIENKTDKVLNFDVLHQFAGAALLALPQTGTVEAYGKRVYPVKFLADKQLISKNIQNFAVQITASINSDMTWPVVSASFTTHLIDAQGLFLDVEQAEVYLDPHSTQVDLPIRVFNNSLIASVFRLEFYETPEGLNFVPSQDTITVAPDEQRLIRIKAVYTGKSRNNADFAVTIRAIDPLGKQLAVKKVRVMALSNSRNLVLNQQDIYFKNRPNTLVMNYVNGNNFNAVQLLGTGKYTLNNQEEVGYNLNFNYYPRRKSYLLNDTYAYYKGEQWGVHVGSIYGNLDYNVNGKGIKGSLFFPGNKRITLYGVDNNYTLASNETLNKRNGYTLATEYVDGIPDKENSRVVLLYNNDKSLNSDSYLASGKQKLFADERNSLIAEGGLSTQTIDQGNLKDNYAGFAVGSAYQFESPSLSLRSYHYYSSPYYAGLRRGLMQSDNSLALPLGARQSLNAQVNYSRSQARYVSEQWNEWAAQINRYTQQTIQLGYQTAMGNNWNMTLSPYYFKQDMSLNSGSVVDSSWTSSSYRIKTALNYNTSKHSIALSMDNGYTSENTSQRPPAPYFSTRVNASYRNNIWGVNAFYQHNPFYISDALANGTSRDYDVLSIGPNISFAALDNRLSVTASAMYYYYGYSKNQNYIGNAHARWNLKNDWAISTELYFGVNRFQNLRQYNPETGLNNLEPNIDYRDPSLYTTRQIKIGVEKKIGAQANGREKKLTLIYFEDLNNNGIQDKGEQLVSGILVKINGLAAITNDKGMVTFTAPTDKVYAPVIANMNGWNTSPLAPSEIGVTKDVKIMMPLVKTVRLSGELRTIKEAYTEAFGSLAGIRVYAKDAHGMVYKTMTNENGRFNLFLPETEYTVSIDDVALPLRVIDNEKSIVLHKGTDAHLTFESRDQRRKVEVKKF
ncbi:hypothetical protein [Sphingobacterium pedocola]|uniref:SD-repeat containing protein B domain-containing protein n=1 Tax=Sphingobacterium pedocola TaxID=2082722 RepID=A0ABR9T9P4_9SPHI|nr:hypothetical protein [Sphingobacterium pedocola]MBE8722070.1 hypothetical protein [Sphingobacterium pedocola]